MSNARTRRWQTITLVTLFTGYTGYYVCRSDLAVAAPLMVADLADQGITDAHLGAVTSLGVLLYAIGKFTNGLLTDFVGGRRLFLLGMAGSVLCTVLFGFASGLVVFLITWAVNRYVQSMGWGALVKIASRWYPVSVHATVMGALSMSYLLGDALGRLYLGFWIDRGAGWRELFFIAAGTLAVIAAACYFTLTDSPRSVGAEEPPANPRNVFGTEGDTPQAESLGRLLGPLLRNPVFWLVCLMCFGLTLIRETFNFWTPTYLKQVAGMSPRDAAWGSAVFPLIGGLAALVGGWVSDRLRGRRAWVAVPSLVLLVAALAQLALTDVRGRPVMALCLIGSVSLFLLAPYSFCSGVLALDLGGKRGSSTAAGFIDGAGYLGGTLSGYGVAAVAKEYGWQTAFGILAVTAGLTVGAAVGYWILHESGAERKS